MEVKDQTSSSTVSKTGKLDGGMTIKPDINVFSSIVKIVKWKTFKKPIESARLEERPMWKTSSKEGGMRSTRSKIIGAKKVIESIKRTESKEDKGNIEGATDALEEGIGTLKDETETIVGKPEGIEKVPEAIEGETGTAENTSKDDDWIDLENYYSALITGPGRNKRRGPSWVHMALRPKFKTQNMIYAVITSLYERLDKIYPHMSKDYLDCHRAVREFLNLAKEEEGMPVTWETATYVLSACGTDKFFDFWDDRMIIMGSRLGLGYRSEPVPDYDDTEARMKLRIMRTKQVCVALKARKMQTEMKRKEDQKKTKKKKQIQGGKLE